MFSGKNAPVSMSHKSSRFLSSLGVEKKVRKVKVLGFIKKNIQALPPKCDKWLSICLPRGSGYLVAGYICRFITLVRGHITHL